jgi:hypothetical protein
MELVKERMEREEHTERRLKLLKLSTQLTRKEKPDLRGQFLVELEAVTGSALLQLLLNMERSALLAAMKKDALDPDVRAVLGGIVEVKEK